MTMECWLSGLSLSTNNKHFPQSSRSSFPQLLLLSLLCLTLLLSPASAMIDKDQSVSCSPDDTFFPFWSFQYASGGSYQLSISLDPGEWLLNNQTVQVILATDSQLDAVRSASMDDVCAVVPYNFSPITWQSRLGALMPTAASANISHIPTNDWYRLLILNCDGGAFNLRFSDVAMNPNGEYLSMSEVPYKMLFLSFLWIWSVALLIWTVHLFAYRKWNISLQSLMALMLVSKILMVVPSLYYWRSASKNGVYPSTLDWIVLLASVFDRIIWFSLLYLLACGYGVLKGKMERSEKRILAFLLATLTISYTIYSIYGGFFLFLMLIFYIVTLRMIFAGIVENSNSLIRQMHILSRHDIDYTLTPLNAKLHMFRYLQVYIVAYVSVDVIFHLWAAIFLRGTPWISDMMEQSISAVMAICLGITFGLRPFNPFYLQIMMLMLENPDLSHPADNGVMGDGNPQIEGDEAAPAEADEIEGDSRGVHVAHSRSRRATTGDDYHSLEDDHGRSVDSDSLISRSRDASAAANSTDQTWTPGSAMPGAHEIDGAVSWSAQDRHVPFAARGRSRSNAAADDEEDAVLIVDNPLDNEHALQLGEAMPAYVAPAAAAALEIDAQLLPAIPKSAYKYLPRYFRSALIDQQRANQRDERGAQSVEQMEARRRNAREQASRDARRARRARADEGYI